MTKKVTYQLEGCETRIRQACDTTMTQRDWCEVWERAKQDAKKGKTALLLCLLPIVARKMQDAQPQVVINQSQPIVPTLAEKLAKYGDPDSANA